MSIKKYLGDYSTEQYVDEKGKVRVRGVYIGGDYTLVPALSKGDKRLVMLFSVLPWFSFIGALIPVTVASRIFYVILPFIFMAFPLFMATGAAGSLFFSGEPMTRERAEKIASRLPVCSLVSAVLSGTAFFALIIAAVFTGTVMLSGDLLFGALSFITCAATSFVYSKCRKIKAHRK